MKKKYNNNKIKYLAGNMTTINNIPISTPILPINSTSTVTANLPQTNNNVPKPPIENIEFTKECVDNNHK